MFALLLAVLLSISLVGPALAAAPDTRDDHALGRFRDASDFGDFSTPLNQSLAILVLARTAGTDPSPAAVDLLLAQQCHDGGFATTFRVPTTGEPAPCNPSVDTTGFAVQALNAVGEDDAVGDAVTWLRTAQEDDGSFGSPDGLNTNSTAVAAVALDIGGETGAADDARAWIEEVQEGCEADERAGAIPFNAETDGFVELATAQSIVGLNSADLNTLDGSGNDDVAPTTDCDQEPAELGETDVAAAAWLADQLVDGERIQSEFEGDFFDAPGPTIDALFAFASLDDLAGEQIGAIVAWLTTQVTGYTQGAPFDADDAAYAGATAKLALGMLVAERDPGNVDDIDLIAQLEGLEVTELDEVSVSCDAEEVTTGEQVDCSIQGLIPNETVDVLVELNPMLLDEPVTADDMGNAAFTFTIPDDVDDGDTVVITLNGLGADGLAELALNVSVAEPEMEEVAEPDDEVADEEDVLPETGSPTVLTGGVGVITLLIGGLALALTHRQRETERA